MNRRLLLKNLLATTPQAAETRKPRIETGADEATIYLYDVIDPFWGISAQEFVKELNAITAPTIHLRINSPGGDVFDGRAIKTALDQHKAKIITHVDGIAASAASFIMLAGDEIEMARGAMVMIHNAWSWCIGNAKDMRATANLLDKVDAQIVRDYEKQTGKSRAQIEEWMAAETWFNEEEAVENGFADRIFEADAVENTFDLSVFARAPAKLTDRKPKTEEDTRTAGDMRAAAEARLALYERTAT